MMTISSRAAAAAFASLFLISTAFAQTTTPAAPAPASQDRRPRKRRPRSRGPQRRCECSKDADAKNVHGKERKKFMSECKKAAKDAAAKSK